MKKELINEIQRQMLPHLNNEQLLQLQRILTEVLRDVTVCYEAQHDEKQMPDATNAFVSAKRIEGCSEKTLKYYRKTIEAMLSGIGKTAQQITTDDLRRYLTAYQSQRRSSKVTIDNIRRILSSFFSWLEDEDFIIKSPVRRIHKVKTAKLVKDTYTDEALELMRDSCSCARDLAIIDLLASSGMRVGEMIMLNREDINFNERECVVVGKGNKERLVYFDARTKIHLQRLLNLLLFPFPVQTVPIAAQQSFGLPIPEPEIEYGASQRPNTIAHIFQPGVQRHKISSGKGDDTQDGYIDEQHNQGRIQIAAALASGDLAPQMLQCTIADIPDVPGGALFIPCHGFGGLAVDHSTEQNLSLQLSQPKQCVVKFLTQIHQRIFLRVFRHIWCPVKPAHIVVDRVAHFFWQKRFRVIGDRLFDCGFFQRSRVSQAIEFCLAVVEHMLKLLPLLWMLCDPLICGSGGCRVHGVYPAPVGAKLFVRLSIFEGHTFTTLSAFIKSLQFETFRFCRFSLSNNRRTISPGWSCLRFGTARYPR